MYVLVELLVNGRRFQPKIRRQIEHLNSLFQQRGRVLRRHTVRQGEKSDVGVDTLDVWFDKRGVDLPAKSREDVRDGFARVLSRGEVRDFHVRMSQQQSDQFLTRIATGTM